ncbi:phospholipase D-like domain-containing protein [Anoxynatronum sibiricum]|uniref:Phospholipase D-like domain-containing protein n=1 Tax=Anoxynatronum sibiricum TaxID=210623 RepID=A0ABU9VYZ7_9CLOT
MKFVENNQIKMAHEVKILIKKSREVLISVAFLRYSGVNIIIDDLEEMIKKGGQVKVLFSSGFGITEWKAVNALQEIGAELKCYQGEKVFHSKGYIFRTDTLAHVIIGSSNISSSALIEGIEWNMSFDSNEFNCDDIINEFNRLWQSLDSRLLDDTLMKELKRNKNVKITDIGFKEDQEIEDPSLPSYNELMDDTKNYIVSRNKVNTNQWQYQIYKTRLEEYSQRGKFNIVIVGDADANDPKIIAIPYDYLKKNILPVASCDDRGRYLFEVRKSDLRFNWRHRISMDGKRFKYKK